MRVFRKTLALAVALVMVLSLLPGAVFARETVAVSHTGTMLSESVGEN